MPSDNPHTDSAGFRPVQSREQDPSGGLSVLGEYRLLRKLGEGGMSTVYLGYLPATQETFAVKVLSDHLADNQAVLQRFRKEAKMSQALSHPNIICGFASGRDKASGRHYLVMEFIDGMTAHQRLEKNGRFSVSEASHILLDIARALEYLHSRNFVHRDIKPDNILLAPDGSAKLADLGVIKHPSKSQDLTACGDGIGTPYYMPWEQTISPDTVDARSDLFALGATYYHLLTGRLPFPGEDEHDITRQKTEEKYILPTEHDANLPREVDGIITRLLAWDPRKRFQNARELMEVVTASGLVDRQFDPDPETREPVELATAPTRADLKQVYVDTPIDGKNEEIWILKYSRPNQAWRKLLGKTHEIIRLLDNGYLPEEVYAARKAGQKFRRIRAYPEFRNVGVGAGMPQPSIETPVPANSTNPLRKHAQPVTSDRDWSSWLDWTRVFLLISIVLLLTFFSGTFVLKLVAHH
jgi:serine/threonine-protein kinase